MEGQQFTPMTYKHRYNIEGYRKALSKVSQGKCGVYPLIDWQGNTMFYVMCKNRRKLRGMCKIHLKCPSTFMRIKHYHNLKRKPSQPTKFFYVILMGYHADEWKKYMKYNTKSWRNF